MTADQLDMFREGTTKVAAPVEHPTPPAVDKVMIPKERLIEHADRLFREGRKDAAMGFMTQAGGFRDHECVPIARALAERYGVV